MKDSERSALAEEFLLFIGVIIRGMDAIFRREMEEYEVTWPQVHMLKVVKYADRLTVTELSNSLMIAAPTASRMIDGLCSKGLLKKEKDSSDQRVSIVVTTPKSERLLDNLLELQSQVMAEVFEGEDPEELAKTIKSLSRFAGKWRVALESKAKKGVVNE
jgi:DNA-binding MarR family transcriptional regulator